MSAMQGTLTAAERSVFVENIPYEATEEQLKDIFAGVGPVISFRLVYDKETGKPKGYGFCEYKDQEMALSAVLILNDYELNGQALRVDSSASEKRKEELTNWQASIGGPPVEKPCGSKLSPEKAPEFISKIMCSLPPEKEIEFISQMKPVVEINLNSNNNQMIACMPVNQQPQKQVPPQVNPSLQQGQAPPQQACMKPYNLYSNPYPYNASINHEAAPQPDWPKARQRNLLRIQKLQRDLEAAKQQLQQSLESAKQKELEFKAAQEKKKQEQITRKQQVLERQISSKRLKIQQLQQDLDAAEQKELQFKAAQEKKEQEQLARHQRDLDAAKQKDLKFKAAQKKKEQEQLARQQQVLERENASKRLKLQQLQQNLEAEEELQFKAAQEAERQQQLARQQQKMLRRQNSRTFLEIQQLQQSLEAAKQKELRSKAVQEKKKQQSAHQQQMLERKKASILLKIQKLPQIIEAPTQSELKFKAIKLALKERKKQQEKILVAKNASRRRDQQLQLRKQKLAQLNLEQSNQMHQPSSSFSKLAPLELEVPKWAPAYPKVNGPQEWQNMDPMQGLVPPRGENSSANKPSTSQTPSVDYALAELQASEIFSVNLVKEVLKQTGKKFKSVHELCDAILEVEGKKQKHKLSQSSQEHKNVKKMKCEVTEENEALLCKICMEQQMNTLFEPCMHIATCMACAQYLQQCPMCRSVITKKAQIYI